MSNVQDSIINNYLKFFDSKFSATNAVYLFDLERSSIKVWTMTTAYKDESRNVHYLLCAGRSLDIKECYIKTLSEFLERYSLTIPILNTKNFSYFEKPESIKTLNLSELEELQGLMKFQYNTECCLLKNFNPSEKLNWCKANYLISNEEVWIPEKAVLLRIVNDLFEVTTNGCAIHSSKKQAIINACCELIERDSFLFQWWKKITPKKIDYKGFLKKANPDLYYAYGIWLRYVNILEVDSGFGLPSLIATFSSTDKNLPAFLMVGCCNPNPIKALEGCLLELAGAINGAIANYKNLKNNFNDIYYFDYEVKNFSHHSEMYHLLKNAELIYFFDYLINSNPSMNFEEYLNNFKYSFNLSEDEQINLLKENFNKNGLNPVIVDQTSNDVQELGLHVIRCVDPAAIDLDARHVYRRWGKKRIGITFDKLNEINHFPHPFP